MRQTIRNFFRHLAGHGPWILGAMLALVLAGWFFILLTDYVSAGKADHFDRRVINHFRHHQGPEVIQALAEDITAIGGPGCWLLVSGMVGGFLMLQRRYYTTAWLFFLVCSGTALTRALKGTINRVPPGHPDNLPAVNYTPSFPSGHSMMAAMVYLAIGVILAQLAKGTLSKLYILSMALVIVFLVGATRVYLCIHWPTDVIAGWAAGLSWALLCWIVTTRLRQIRQQHKLKHQALA